MKQSIIRLFCAMAAAGVILGSPTLVRAELIKADTPWALPTYVYGAGLNQQEIVKTA